MKKLISIILTLTMVLSLSISVGAVEYGEELKNQPSKTYTQKFSDVPKDFWAFSYIGEMAERGVLSGYPDGKFYPDSQVTRAEFAKIMTMAAGLKIEQPTMQIFNDVAINEWYAPYIHTAKSYLSAYNQNGGSYYLPDMPAIREDIAVAMVKLKGYSVVGADMTMLSRMFSDYQSISSEAQKYVASAVENGLISGYDDGTFRGQQSITRAEAATLLWRAYQYGNNNKTYDDKTPTQTPSVTPPTNEPQKTESPIETKPQDTPTPEVKKPYIIKELASANVNNVRCMTFDGQNDIFYIDSSNENIYKINVSNGSKSQYMTTSDLKLEETEEQENEVDETITEIIVDEESGEETEVTKTVTKTVKEEVVVAEYSSYVPTQVFYDNANGRLLLIGYYENVTEAFSAPKKGQEYIVIYDITNGNAEFCCNVNGSLGDLHDNHWSFIFQIALNGTSAIVSNTMQFQRNTYKLDMKSGELARIHMAGNDLSYLKSGSDLYSVNEWGSNRNYIIKYDFNNDDYTELSDEILYESLGRKNGYFYFWDSDGLIYKISAKNGQTTTLDISTKSEKVEFSDMGNMNNIAEIFFVIDDDTMVFYDIDMESFRILMKNN